MRHPHIHRFLKPLSPPSTLQEVLAEAGHGPAAAAFGLCLGLLALRDRARRDASCLWIRLAKTNFEAGNIYGPGLLRFGAKPEQFVFAHLESETDVLKAGLEGARCGAVGVVLIETFAPVDLTSSRKLKLAANATGVTVVIMRHRAEASTNAARVRWRIASASQSTLSKNSGQPTFDATLIKHPTGAWDHSQRLEWDRDRQDFAPTLSQSLVSLSSGRSLAA